MEATDRLTVSLEGQLQKHAELKTVSDFCLLRVMMTSNIQDYLKRIPFLTKVPMTKIQMTVNVLDLRPSKKVVSYVAKDPKAIGFMLSFTES